MPSCTGVPEGLSCSSRSFSFQNPNHEEVCPHQHVGLQAQLCTLSFAYNYMIQEFSSELQYIYNILEANKGD